MVGWLYATAFTRRYGFLLHHKTYYQQADGYAVPADVSSACLTLRVFFARRFSPVACILRDYL